MNAGISMEVLGNLLEKSKIVTKIKINNLTGSGLLCKIPFPDEKNIIPMLVTCNHILKNEDITQGKMISFTLDNDKKAFEILIDESRKIYSNEEYDITMLEIRQSDGLNIETFLEIDENIFSKNSNEIIKNELVSLLSYPKGENLSISNGIIKGIEENGYTIHHLCNTCQGCAGGPILNQNLKVIAIHVGYYKNKNYNIGTFLKKPIEDFIKQKNNK
jgi:V8-like Glu-specific endopeptidase